MLRRLLVLTALGAACARDAEPHRVPPRSESVAIASAAPMPPEPVAVPSRDAAPPEDPRTPIGSWGIEVAIPEGAVSERQAEANRHSIRISADVSAALVKVKLPAPKTLDEARAQWRGEQQFDLGTTPDGAFYTVVSFQVRVGVPSRPGMHLHTFKTISRVYAVIELDVESRVECTGYVERRIESIEDEDIQRLRKICISMRRTK